MGELYSIKLDQRRKMYNNRSTNGILTYQSKKTSEEAEPISDELKTRRANQLELKTDWTNQRRTQNK